MQDNIDPINYYIIIKPDLSLFTFRGYVKINIICTSSTDKIILNSKNIKINKIHVDNTMTSFNYDVENELIIINSIIKKGYHDIEIRYNGIINNNLCGFYRSSYVDNDNNTKYIYSTQHESHDFRQTCPSFDRPDKKATFDIVIIAPNDKIVLSNNDVKEIKKYDNNYLVHIFETTPKMSSYLVCFVIGDLIYKEIFTKDNIRIRTYASKENEMLLEDPLNIASKALDLLDRWFDVKYSISGLKKLDLVAIPNFASGAMENWGCTTYRTEALLFDKNTNLSKKQNAIITIVHELAHQIFGNLVTMKKWEYLWLNESFATWMSYYIVDIMFPEWNIWEKFIEEEYIKAFAIDSLQSSHPIEVNIKSEKDISQIFDSISYAKGACLIRFLFHYIGEEQFQKGLQHYIKNNMFGNTVSDDLWDSISLVSNKNVKNIMNCWIQQKGFPIISINCSNTDIKLEQTQFLKLGSKQNKIENPLWIIPLNILTNCDDNYEKCQNVDIYFNDHAINIPLYNANISNILVNPDRTVFCITKYINRKFKIYELLEKQQQQVLYDMFYATMSGYDTFKNLFIMLTEVKYEDITNVGIWDTIINNIIFLCVLCENSNEHELKELIINFCKKYIYKHVKILFKKFGFNDREGDSINIIKIRPLFIKFLRLMKDDETIKDAKQLFLNNNYNNILEIVGEFSTQNEYNKLINLLKYNTDTHLKDDIISGLSVTSNELFIDYMINNLLLNHVKEQDINRALHNLSLNNKATYKLWTFIKNQWSNIIKIHTPCSSSLTRICKSIASGMCTIDMLSEYVAFFKKHKPEGTEMIIKQTIETIISRIRNIKRMKNEIDFINMLHQ
jgi:aminopeptidase N